jgi:tRNA/tmRNA/rRNA uracil-C5-methylase (TrmA/RlmC/RlmD family)
MRAGCVSGCPGCSYSATTYRDSLNKKSENLSYNLSGLKERFRGFRFELDPFDYRRKALLFPNDKFQWGLRKPIPGTYDLEVVPIPQCPVHSPLVRKSARELESLAPVLQGLPVFAALILEDRVGLVLKSKPIALPESLQSAKFKSFWVCFHPSAGDRVFDHRGWEPVFGPFEWQDERGHWISFGAFTQQRLRLHEHGLEIVQDFFQGTETVLDLYCGTARSVKRFFEKQQSREILAIELSAHAAMCARKNAPAATILQGKVEHRIPQIQEWLKSKRECSVLINPPREGVHRELIELLNSNPVFNRLAYLSCSSRTLGRDLNFFSQNWTVLDLIALDFFPWARHYEVLALMERK